MQLKQVLLTIIKNGIEAIKSDGTLTIHISKDIHNVYISISVDDSGITAGRLNKIRQPLFTTNEQGTNLGLMVSFNIIKKHHGSIFIESKENRGSTFTVTLPLAHQSAPALPFLT
ncbi:MAG: ATP-binding protein [Bacillota bacterium]